MSIRPVSFNTDGSIDLINDENGHSGTIQPSQILWSQLDGLDNHNYTMLNCPDGCGYISGWPVAGGADAINGQALFIHKVEANGCACGQVTSNDNSALPESHVRLNVNRMEGPGRWQASEPSKLELFKSGRNIDVYANSEKMFQVVYNKTTRLIVGLEPAGGVGPDNSVGVIHDLDEYEVLMQTDPAYLSVDGDHIVGTSPNAT